VRIVMFGYQTWGHRTLAALLASGHEVALVVTHPRSEHAYEKIWDDNVADLATQNGIPVVLQNRPDEALFARLQEIGPDLIVANNWRTYLPEQIWSLPTHGTLNVHDSLLPAYAGFSPLIWALINGEPEVGVTAHLMDETLDAGPIVAQKAVPVGPRDTTTDLFHKTLELIEPILLESLAAIESGRSDFTVQDRSRASFFHKRSDRDSRIDWTWPAAELDRLVRALSDPYPSAYCFYQGERLRITGARVSTQKYGGTPGRIFYREDDGVVIVAGAQSRRGTEPGLCVVRVRTEDGADHLASDFFTKMGGYLD
jgi:methionyl-tRNA formyltransferase